MRFSCFFSNRIRVKFVFFSANVIPHNSVAFNCCYIKNMATAISRTSWVTEQKRLLELERQAEVDSSKEQVMGSYCYL